MEEITLIGNLFVESFWLLSEEDIRYLLSFYYHAVSVRIFVNSECWKKVSVITIVPKIIELLTPVLVFPFKILV